MRVVWAVMADFANVTQDGKLNLFGVFQEVRFREFPSVLPHMYLAMLLEAQDADVGQEKRMVLSITGPNGAELVPPLEGRVVVPQMGQTDAPIIVNQIIGLAGMVFPEAGEYTISFRLDEDEVQRFTLPVRAQGLAAEG